MANTATLTPTAPTAHSGSLPGVTGKCGQRKRVICPFIPGLSQTVIGTVTGNGGLTFAGVLSVAGDAVGDGAVDINGTHVLGVDLDGNNEEACMNVFVPDDMNVNETLWVHLIWVPETVSSSDDFDYVVTYAANKVTDYAASASGTALTEATTALSGTALNETVTLDGLTQYAPYRSMRGIINAGTFEQDGIISLKTECDVAPGSSEVIQLLAIELWYVQRKY
jgi:hypothetical protein